MTREYLIITDSTDAFEDYRGPVQRTRSKVKFPLVKHETNTNKENICRELKLIKYI